MIHNGIEHGMMSALAEAWHIMSLHLGMKYGEIGEELARWNETSEMVYLPLEAFRFIITDSTMLRKVLFSLILGPRYVDRRTKRGNMSFRLYKTR